MIIAKIIQNNLELTIQEINIPYQYSQGLEIEFIRDKKHKDYTLLAFYKLEGDTEAKLTKCNNDIISIAKDVFKKIGKVSFSFSLTKDEEVIHLGVVEFYVRRAFGSDESILPQEDKNTWMDLIENIAKDRVDNYWNSFYKEQIDRIVRDINSKVSDASTYANQANLAKTEASKSATDASNSASSALESSNKAKEHLDNMNTKVTEFNKDYAKKIADFNEDYASKLENFNSNVENANNALDKKILDANTDIDKKVLDANTNLDKKITDANTNFEAKVTVATEQANIATSKATELSQAVDKVKYLEDVVDTKLTQPYVSSGNIENATISDSDEGQLRNLRIYGKCTQKVETDIVPTPSRPVPIISKKINVGGEVVELRSLKESSNLFDINYLHNQTINDKQIGIDSTVENGILTANSFTSSHYGKGQIISVKKNTDYTVVFKFYEENADKLTVNINAKTTNNYSLKQFSNKGIDINNVFNFNTGNNDVICLCFLTVGDGNTPKVKIKDIMLVEGTTVPSSYVPSTVRDYKIVDHINKRSWIERNVGLQSYTGGLGFNDWREDQYRLIFGIADRKPLQKVGAPNILCNIAYPFASGINLKDVLWETGNTSLYWYPNIYSLGLDGTETKADANIKLNEFLATTPMFIQYELAEPITEEIPYIESDTSEFGVSSQDTTSPSPNIKSEVETISTLNIKVCNINLLSNKLEQWYFRKTLGWGASTGTPVPKPNTFSNVGYSAVIEVNGILPNTKYSFYNADTKNLWVSRIVEMDDNYIGYCNHRLYDNVETDNKEFYAFTTSVHTTKLFLQIRTCPITGNGASRDIEEKDISNMQITFAVGEVKEHYRYQENGFYYELENPLMKCGDIVDTIDLNKLERKNNIYKEDITTLTISSVDNAGGYNHTNTTNRFYNLNKRSVASSSGSNRNVYSTIFPYNNSVWAKDETGITINARNQVHVCLPNLLIGVNKNDSSEDRKIKLNNYIKSLKGTGNEYIYYAVEEPTVEPLEPELIEKLKTLKTFYPITHIISNVPLEFDYKLNMPAWHKVVSGEVEDARNIIYDLTVKQNSLEVMQLESSLNMQYNMDLLKLQGGM